MESRAKVRQYGSRSIENATSVCGLDEFKKNWTSSSKGFSKEEEEGFRRIARIHSSLTQLGLAELLVKALPTEQRKSRSFVVNLLSIHKSIELIRIESVYKLIKFHCCSNETLIRPLSLLPCDSQVAINDPLSELLY